MRLLKEYLIKAFDYEKRNNKMLFIGDKSAFSGELLDLMLDIEEKTKDRNLTEVFQDHLPCSDADKCRVSDLPHGISSNGEQKAGGRAEREFPGAGSSGSLRL